MANQYTPSAQRKKPRLDPEEQRQAIKIGAIRKRLQDAALGKCRMTTDQVAAARCLMDKAIPTLSAVESTVIEQSARQSEADILAQLGNLIRSHPDLLQLALAEQARQAPLGSPESVAGAQQVVDAALQSPITATGTTD